MEENAGKSNRRTLAKTTKRVGLIKRHEANPILTAEDWPYPANAVFNAGATRLQDGTTLLLLAIQFPIYMVLLSFALNMLIT